MEKWEYKIVYGWWLSQNKLLEEINRLGAEGWEVCGYASYGLAISWTLKNRYLKKKNNGIVGSSNSKSGLPQFS